MTMTYNSDQEFGTLFSFSADIFSHRFFMRDYPLKFAPLSGILIFRLTLNQYTDNIGMSELTSIIKVILLS